MRMASHKSLQHAVVIGERADLDPARLGVAQYFSDSCVSDSTNSRSCSRNPCDQPFPRFTPAGELRKTSG
jgi:hypothetical protein